MNELLGLGQEVTRVWFDELASLGRCRRGAFSGCRKKSNMGQAKWVRLQRLVKKKYGSSVVVQHDKKRSRIVVWVRVSPAARRNYEFKTSRINTRSFCEKLMLLV